jgi:DNA end-binding protein Ku
MRSIWNGHLVLDLPGIGGLPIGLGSANEDTGVHFKTLHASCKTPIKQQKWCPTCEVVAEETVKGFEHTKGEFVILTDSDLEPLDLLSDKTITIREFVPSVDPLHFDKNYYLLPPKQPAFAMMYAVLRDTMFDTGKVAIGQFIFREREQLCAIRPGLYALIATTLRYQEEVREPDFECPGASDLESRSVMSKVIDMLSSDYLDWSQYRDKHRDGVLEVVKAKLADTTFVPAAKEAVPELSAEDWLESLKESVAELSRRRKELV